MDFEYNNILINLNHLDRDVDDNRIVQDYEKWNQGIYNLQNYTYFDAKVFLGVNRIRPGELDTSLIESLSNYNDLNVRFYDYNDNIKDNILGIAPNSDIWKYW